MTQAHEDHIHLLVCIDRLQSAWNTLKIIESSSDHLLVGPAFRYALVEYATAFTRSDGPIKKYRRLELSPVPTGMQDLHKRIIEARHNTHAHADLISLEAKLYVTHTNGRKFVNQSQNYIHGLEELKNLSDIISLVEAVLDNLEIMRLNSEKELAP